MSVGEIVGVIDGIISGVVLLLLAALGYFGKRALSRYDRMAEDVNSLLTERAVTERIMPGLMERVASNERAAREHGQQIEVLRDWRERHERWIEQRGIGAEG